MAGHLGNQVAVRKGWGPEVALAEWHTVLEEAHMEERGDVRYEVVRLDVEVVSRTAEARGLAV